MSPGKHDTEPGKHDAELQYLIDDVVHFSCEQVAHQRLQTSSFSSKIRILCFWPPFYLPNFMDSSILWGSTSIASIETKHQPAYLQLFLSFLFSTPHRGSVNRAASHVASMLKRAPDWCCTVLPRAFWLCGQTVNVVVLHLSHRLMGIPDHK